MVIVPVEKKMTCKICWKVKLIYFFLIKVVAKEPQQGKLYCTCWVQVGSKEYYSLPIKIYKDFRTLVSPEREEKKPCIFSKSIRLLFAFSERTCYIL